MGFSKIKNKSETNYKTNKWQKESPPKEFITDSIKQIKTEDVSHCPICNNSQFKQIALGFDFEIKTCSNPWRFVCCNHCSHVWLNPRPAISELQSIYPSTYYAYDYEKRINSIAVYGKQMLDFFKFRSILRYCKKLNSYLDIGCGSGRFLNRIEKKGVKRNKIFGIDLDGKAIRALSNEGFQVFCGRVENCNSIQETSIDLVTMFHVIEHVENPSSVIRKIKSWLNIDGTLAIETPNVDSLDWKLFKSMYWGGYHIPRHWNLFTPNSLCKLLNDAGFKIISTKFQTGHSFWMFSFHHLFRYGKNPKPILARFFDPFLLSNLPLLILFTLFDKIRAAIGFKTSSMLIIARKLKN